MIDFTNLEQYRENNRIEAKRALGGLPQSIWETYSAFANTLGGIILLGVEEDKDGSLYPINLPDPGRLVRDFWEQVNDPRRTNVNILSAGHVQIREADGKRIVAITVPRAQRSDRPVYIGTDPMTGTYRRNGEGDYRCTTEEIEGMLRDASVQTSDMKILGHMELDLLDGRTIRSYRRRMEEIRPGHAWQGLDTSAFLCRLGAAGRGADGRIHPTVAGLLAFSREPAIREVFPHYLLRYQEWGENHSLPFVQILSSSGDWSGNLYDFYTRVGRKLTRHIPLPAAAGSNGVRDRIEAALREALGNCLINADYYGKQGISIARYKDALILSNPGDFRVEIEEAKSGGVSDPRGAALLRIFNLVRASSGIGSGVPHIFSAWQVSGWEAPILRESFNPPRTTLTLPFTVSAPGKDNRSLPRTDGGRETVLTTLAQKASVIDYLTRHAEAGPEDLSRLLHLSDAAADQRQLQGLLDELAAAGILSVSGDEPDLSCRLKT